MLKGLTTVDHKGGTFVFAFTNIRENVGLKDSDFHFTFPRNTMSFIQDRRVVRAAGIALAATGIALGVACATGSTLRQARSAEQSRDFRPGRRSYSRVVHADPDNREARSGLERAKLRAAESHLGRGRRSSRKGSTTMR